jgi:hypothetical protein
MSTQFSSRSPGKLPLTCTIYSHENEFDGGLPVINCVMDPYAKPNERKVGAKRPKISHLPSEIDKRTRNQRRAEKQAVAAERRAIKKSARRQLKKQLIDELNER